jgi:hypothetical protein
MNTNNSTRWSVSQDVRATYSEDGAVLLDIRKGLCYSLNPVAARVWVTLETSADGITMNGIVSALDTECQVPLEELEGDTAELLDKLRHMGLVHCNGDGRMLKNAGGRT